MDARCLCQKSVDHKCMSFNIVSPVDMCIFCQHLLFDCSLLDTCSYIGRISHHWNYGRLISSGCFCWRSLLTTVTREDAMHQAVWGCWQEYSSSHDLACFSVVGPPQWNGQQCQDLHPVCWEPYLICTWLQVDWLSWQAQCFPWENIYLSLLKRKRWGKLNICLQWPFLTVEL